MRFQKILIAIDDDPIANQAADTGLELARCLHADMAFIHVIDPPLGVGADAGMVGEDIIRQAREEGARIVADFRARLTLGPDVLQFVPQGPPGSEIVKAARQWQADLIVIGSHGRRGIRRALIGSVAEAVVRQAPCPVLVVRAKG